MGIKKIKLVICLTTALFIIAGAVWLGQEPKKIPTLESVPKNVQGIILPHHLLVDFFIQDFYQQLSATNSYDRIILISPNHFNAGYRFIQSADTPDEEKLNVRFDKESIHKLSSAAAVSLEPKLFAQEHGITTHLTYINQFFPEASIIPIIIKLTTPEEQLHYLVQELLKITNEETLIIASIDFSHYEEESFAKKNDGQTIKWLQNLSKNESSQSSRIFKESQQLALSSDPENKDAVGIDSPESLYVLASLMRQMNSANWTLWARTSTALLIPEIRPEDNTSHIFGYFINSY